MRFFSLFLMLVVVTIGIGFLGNFWLAGRRASEDSREQFVMVQPGESFGALASRLEKSGIIADARTFRWYAVLHGLVNKIKVGEYALRPNMSTAEILALVVSGKSILHKLTIPEGSNRFQIADILANLGLGDRKRFLEAVESPELTKLLGLVGASAKEPPTSLEGFLYPDTYMISRLMNEREIAKLMVKRSLDVLGELEPTIVEARRTSGQALSVFDLVTLASMVEKETGAGRERPLIASVFYNRLKKNMRLQSDPTTIYGIWDRDGSFDGNIRRKDLTTPTPYNTYTLNRLPKGPIANPGRDALIAVLKPAESPYLYFVSKNDGTHVFTSSYPEHQKAVDMLQKNPSARAGKSWRDLPSSERANKL